MNCNLLSYIEPYRSVIPIQQDGFKDLPTIESLGHIRLQSNEISYVNYYTMGLGAFQVLEGFLKVTAVIKYYLWGD